ncbi:MAG: rhodanese-like domain-containing protein [Burkholderiales bacterium]
MVLEFLQKNLLLVAAAAVSGGMLVWPMLRGAGGASIGTLEATQLMNRENAVVLDVRDAATYAAGHLLGARNLPLAELDQRAGELDKLRARPVIVVCETGTTSGRALKVLKARGFERAVSLGGGFRAWLQGGLPVEK